MLFGYPNNSTEVRNMDYILKEFTLLDNKVNLKINEAIKAFLLAHFNSLFADVSYNEDTRTLKLYLNIAADGLHVYHMDNESINVGGGDL